MENKITKTLYFYELHIKLFDIIASSDNECMKSTYSREYFIKKTFREIGTYPVTDNKIVDILTIDDSLVFGSIGKFQNPYGNALRRLRDPNTYEPIQIDNNDEHAKEILEDFTYFLIGNNFKNIVVLNNSQAPTLDTTLATLINSKCPELEKVLIAQVPIDDLTKKLNRLTKILKVSFSAAHQDNFSNMILPDCIYGLSGTDVDKYTITLNLKREVAGKKFIESLCNGNYSDYTNFKVSGSSDNTDIVETVDLIKKVCTKKVPITISNDTLKDNESIKNILYNELLHNIK